jgi:hypothetical protein
MEDLAKQLLGMHLKGGKFSLATALLVVVALAIRHTLNLKM